MQSVILSLRKRSSQACVDNLCNIFFLQGYLKVDITVLGKGDPAKVRCTQLNFSLLLFVELALCSNQ